MFCGPPPVHLSVWVHDHHCTALMFHAKPSNERFFTIFWRRLCTRLFVCIISNGLRLVYHTYTSIGSTEVDAEITFQIHQDIVLFALLYCCKVLHGRTSAGELISMVPISTWWWRFKPALGGPRYRRFARGLGVAETESRFRVPYLHLYCPRLSSIHPAVPLTTDNSAQSCCKNILCGG